MLDHIHVALRYRRILDEGGYQVKPEPPTDSAANRRPITEDEVAFIRQKRQEGMSWTAIADQLDRAMTSIHKRARKEGIK